MECKEEVRVVDGRPTYMGSLGGVAAEARSTGHFWALLGVLVRSALRRAAPLPMDVSLSCDRYSDEKLLTAVQSGSDAETVRVLLGRLGLAMRCAQEMWTSVDKVCLNNFRDGVTGKVRSAFIGHRYYFMDEVAGFVERMYPGTHAHPALAPYALGTMEGHRVLCFVVAHGHEEGVLFCRQVQYSDFMEECEKTVFVSPVLLWA